MSYTCGETVADKESCQILIDAIPTDVNDPNYASAVTAAVNAGATAVEFKGGKRRRRKTMKKMKKMSKRKMAKWCKSKKNRRTKAGRKMCKK